MNIIKHKSKGRTPVEIDLVEADGAVDVVVVNSDGDPLCHLCTISSDGIKLWPSIDEDLGFDLDHEGRLQIED